MSEVKRELNLFQIVAIIVGLVIGSGIFINIAPVQRATGSPGLAVIAWVVGGLILLPQIFIYAELGTAYPKQGFGYLYLQKAGSPMLAFLYTWTAFWTSDMPSITILSLAAVTALNIFFPVLTVNAIATKLLAIAVIVILTTIHIRSVKQGSWVQVILTVLKIIPLVILAIIGLFYLDSPTFFIKPHLVEPAKHSIFWLIMMGAAGTVWSYAGFPNIMYMAGEIKNPKRNIPLALIGCAIFVMLMYVLISYASAAIIPHEELINTQGFLNPFKYLPIFSTFAAGFLGIAAFISCVGATNVCIMSQPRLEYAMAKDGLFFAVFGKIHPKFGTPVNSILLQSGLAIILVFISQNTLDTLLGYFTFSYLLQNILVYASIFWLHKRDDYHPSYRSPMWRIMAMLSIVLPIILIIASFNTFPLIGILFSITFIIAGIPVYYIFKRKNSS
ncbi:MAG: amino acid permease [Candidatus Marinimicrobia bacterium]|nr:amino acid permease [Candidatus Neomarinimicrobiota bacterium]